MTVYLVSCVGQKRSNPSPAKDLYTSTWFRKARMYVEGMREPWFVLSAKHGLVHPDDRVESYELTLNTMGKADRHRWAERVLSQLGQHLRAVDSVTFLAGQRYREFLEPALRDMGLAVSVPMRGLKIGEQLSWLTGQSGD
jgi:hypothetical protein